jgi:hypothetical protein
MKETNESICSQDFYSTEVNTDTEEYVCENVIFTTIQVSYFFFFLRMKKITLLSALLAGCISLTTLASPSPVVQVISYKEPLGMYFSLQGW